MNENENPNILTEREFEDADVAMLREELDHAEEDAMEEFYAREAEHFVARLWNER